MSELLVEKNRCIKMRYLVLVILMMASTTAFLQSPLRTVDIPDYEYQPHNSDLQFLNAEINNVQIVGIGESTHGTREFKAMYLKMFRYLVEEHNFNTLFLEDEFVPCSRLDSYVKCEHNCDSLTTSVLNYWCWSTHEVNDLIQWIRAYNLSHKSNQISIIGIDIQDAESICTELNSVLTESNIDSVYLPKAKNLTDESQIDNYRLRFSNQSNIDAYKDKLSLINANKIDYYTQLLDYLNWNRIVSANPKRRQLRDLAMGENILAVLENNPQAKGLLIAHNAHIFKYNKGKQNEMKNFILTGGVLDQALGEKYYCIMQDFDGGCFNAYKRTNSGDKNDTSNYELSEVCIEESIENTIGATLRNKDKVMTFITEDHLFKLIGEKLMRYHNIGAAFNPQKDNANQTDDFYVSKKGIINACIFHQKSTASALIKTPLNK